MFRTVLVSLMMLPAALAGAPHASAQTGPAVSPAPPPYAVVRLGDGQMSCSDLVAEIGAITTEMDDLQRDMMSRSMAMGREATASLGGGGGGAAMTLGGLAASFIPGADMLLGAAASAVAAAQLERQRGELMDEAQEMAGEALAIGPMSQRLEHLAELAREREC